MHKEENIMSNNNKTNNTNNEQTIQKMLKNTVKVPFKGIKFEVRTRALGDAMCGLLYNMGVPEIDHVAIYPVTDEKGNFMEFGVDAIFNLEKKLQAGEERTLARFGKNIGGNTGDNPVLRMMAAKTKAGGFTTTDKFNKVMAGIALTDDNDNIRVLADPSGDKRLAMVECDFLSVMALALNVGETDNIDFTITDCRPVNPGDKNVDFKLIVEKTIIEGNFKKHKSSGINYENRDRARMRARRR